MTEKFHRAITLDALPEGQSAAVEIAGWPVLICRTNGDFHALINRCTHADSQLAGGRIRHGAIMCPAHGAPFKLATGECMARLPYRPLKVFPLREIGGWIEVAVPDAPPPAQYQPVPQPAGSNASEL